MQACQVCGAIEVDPGGYCTGCGQFRGTRSYAIAQPAVASLGDIPAVAAYGEPVYQAATGSYPVSPGALAVANAPVSPVGSFVDAEPARPARSPLATPLFLLTVMVVVLVAGTVSVVLIKTNHSAKTPPAAAATTSATATPPASPSASAVVDRCVVGDWAVTSLTVKSEDVDLATNAGGIFQLRADGTGSWDLGSGITLTGTIEDIRSEDLITGRMDFKYRTTGQSFSFQDVRNDVREVISQGRNKPVSTQSNFLLSVAEYTCAGDATRLKWGGIEVQMGRK